MKMSIQAGVGMVLFALMGIAGGLEETKEQKTIFGKLEIRKSDPRQIDFTFMLGIPAKKAEGARFLTSPALALAFHSVKVDDREIVPVSGDFMVRSPSMTHVSGESADIHLYTMQAREGTSLAHTWRLMRESGAKADFGELEKQHRENAPGLPRYCLLWGMSPELRYQVYYLPPTAGKVEVVYSGRFLTREGGIFLDEAKYRLVLAVKETHGEPDNADSIEHGSIRILPPNAITDGRIIFPLPDAAGAGNVSSEAKEKKP